MKGILEKLYAHQHLTRKEATDVLAEISQNKYSKSQIASFITVFNMRKISPQEVLGFRDCLLERCVKVDLSSYKAIDIVGTGGDGKDTFNISTLSCFVVAGAGEKVIKHGNYSASSVSGSSHMLEAFGYRFTQDQGELERYLESSGVCFLHAPLFHPALKSVAEIRKELGVKTFFNIMGPLVNPARPSHQLLGTFNVETARLYHSVLEQTQVNYKVVCSVDGYDEVSLTDSCRIYDQMGENSIEPSDFGFQKIKPNEIKGGKTVEENAKIFLDILKGNGSQAQNQVVCANAGLAIKTLNPQYSLEESVLMAKESLNSKKALAVFEKLMNL